MEPIRLHFLGAPRLERGGHLVTLDRHKAVALLAYLAVTGQRFERERLAALLWPDQDHATGRASLRRALSALTTALPGPWWEVDREAIGLRPDPGLWTDIAAFREHQAACRRHGHPEQQACPDCQAPLTAAAALYRDDFLAGLAVRDSAAFDEWQFLQAEGLRRELSSVLERLAGLHAAQGEPEPAVTAARRWLALDPLHEPAHRLLMRLYAAAGQLNAALRQYQECVRVLQAELGVAPEAATTALHDELRRQRAGQATVPAGLAKPAGPSYHPARRLLETAQAIPAYPAQAEPEATRQVSPTAARPMVGREAELQSGASLWRQARAGETRVQLVSGEPGIGKTRYVEALLAVAQAEGSLGLLAECYAEGSRPYQPVAQFIRQMLLGPFAAQLALPPTTLADLLALTPDLQRHFSHVRRNPRLAPESEQQRLFDHVYQLVEAFLEAAQVPLLLVVEDAHWADSGTLELLQQLARRRKSGRAPAEAGLLLVLTYRSAEAAPETARLLNEMAVNLRRERLVDLLKLVRLDRERTAALVLSLLGAPAPPGLTDEIYRETEGNPFFVEEVCRNLVATGQLKPGPDGWTRTDDQPLAIPETVTAAILARLGRLPAAAQETLRLAAILGREFDADVLQRASSLSEPVLDKALEAAVQAQIIDEVRARAGTAEAAGPLQFSFAHALIPFALREAMGGLARQRLHGRAAAALEALRPEEYERLAYHLGAAGEAARARHYAVLAARRAEAVFEYTAAARYWQLALQLLEGHAALDARVELLEHLADSYSRSGDWEHAVAVYAEALDGLRLQAQPSLVNSARLHRKSLQVLVDTRFRIDFARQEEAARLALANQASLKALLPRLAAGVAATAGHELARVLAALSWHAWLQGLPKPDWDTSEAYAAAAVAAAEQLDQPRELSAALHTLASVLYARGRLRERVALAQRRLALTGDPRFDDSHERAIIISQLGAALADVGEYARALPYLQEGEALAEQIKAAEQQVYALKQQVRCWYHLDRWDDVLAAEPRWRALERRYRREHIGAVCFEMAFTSAVYAWRGALDYATRLRSDALGIMLAITGQPDNWWQDQHY